MARALSMTRLELKRQREKLTRYERFLPALELRRQHFQAVLQALDASVAAARAKLEAARSRFEAYGAVLGDPAGVDVRALAQPTEVRVRDQNLFGLVVPQLEGVSFPPADYSLVTTPTWVDRALDDLRAASRLRVELDVLVEQQRLVRRELTRVAQRVNLFEKVEIPRAKNAVHRIRIHLGDEMAAAVGRAKIARGRSGRDE